MSSTERVRTGWNRFFQPEAPPHWPEEQDVRAFHRSLPGYAPTPLVSMPVLAEELGLAAVYVKDESKRFGLNAFKVLGASYAMYRFLKQRWEASGRPSGEFQPASFLRPDFTAALGSFTFATATDGNHGRAVAWTARRLQQKAVIYVPGNTVPARIEALRGEGAEVVVVDGTYDDTVRRAASDAARAGWQVISDTAYEGYTEIPRWIMEGYGTLFAEAGEQLGALGAKETAVLLQAGVGGLACAGTLYYQRRSGARPTLVSVEPTDADCLLESISSTNGAIRVARGQQNSIMAGLNCGTPSLLAWPVIRAGMELFLAVDDDYAREAMRRFASGKRGDPKIVSGESGAAGLAGLLALCRDPALADARKKLGRATVLLVSTEGDTDPVSYRRIVG